MGRGSGTEVGLAPRCRTVGFTGGLVVVLVGLVVQQVDQSNRQRSADRSVRLQLHITRDIEQIRYYDEVLTMSARLAAASGDAAYVDRYHRAVPKLEQAIAHALARAEDPQAQAALASSSQTNQELIEIEERSFRRLAAGDRAGAYAMLVGADYSRLKADYTRHLDRLLQGLKVSVVERRAASARDRQVGALTTAAALIALVVLWTVTALGLRRTARHRDRIEHQLRALAMYDPLTGLANRSLLVDRIGLASRRRDRGLIAVFYADLDDFKRINDERGHPDGDLVLTEVGRRLQRAARPADTVARLGGDEFAVLVDGLADTAEVAELARRFAAVLSPPIDVNGTSVWCGASIGSATLDGSEDAPEPENLLFRADLAMYAAKRSRKGSWAPFEEGMYEDIQRAARLRADLQEAFAHGQLAVWYQPIVDLRTFAMVGVEALVRWNHPERGVVGPDDFLPAATEAGRLGELTRFVLGEACRWARQRTAEWPDEAPLDVSVNVSPTSLLTSEIVDDVRRALEESELPASRLILEVTESAGFGALEVVSSTLTTLRALGVTVAVDDFGTGFSSVSHLRRLPVDGVKIDKSFTDGLATELEDSTVVAALMRLAHTLSLPVVAEGVELPKQLAALRELGCEFVQGYLIGKPTPADAVPSPADIERLMTSFGIASPHAVVSVDSLTVLVADDQEDERRLLQRALERSGRFTVVGEATDGVDAVRLATTLNPHVVLLDLEMSRLDGLSALPLIVAAVPTTRVVIVSGHVTDELRRRAMAVGAAGCLEKGFADVPTALLEILDQRRRR